jgi:hypothetical protein
MQVTYLMLFNFLVLKINDYVTYRHKRLRKVRKYYIEVVTLAIMKHEKILNTELQT